MTATTDAPIRRSACGSYSLSLRCGAWWLHPAWAAILAVTPALVLAWLTPDDDFRLWWHTPKYVTSAGVLLTALLLGAFVVGTVVPSLARGGGVAAGRPPQVAVTTAQLNILRQAGRVCAVLALAGYAAWVVIALSRGYGSQQLQAALTLQRRALLSAREEYFAPVAGVTSITQLAPIALVCLLLDRRLSGRRHWLLLSMLAVVTAMRAVVHAERLALIEMAVPAVVLAATLLPRGDGRTRRRWLWAALPLFAPAILAVVFGVFEYTRSWNDFYAQHSKVGFGEFVLQRLGGYYATAGNNSAMLLTFAPFVALPFFTVRFIWGIPFLSSLLQEHATLRGDPDVAWVAMLTRYGNPEFNNDGGILPAIADYGLPGALVWWGAVGLLIGLCHRWSHVGELRGMVLYPVLYVGLLEMARVFYWGNGRAFVVIAGGCIVAALLHRARAREEDRW